MPGLETINISTISRLLLKYCPNIRLAESRVKLTPIPGTKQNFGTFVFKNKVYTLYETKTDDQLVELRGEGGEEAGQRHDEPARHGRQTRGLVTTE